MTVCNTVTSMTNRNALPGSDALTRDEAAAALRLSLSTIDRYIKDGTLRKVRVGKRLVRIPRSSIDALLVPALADSVPEVESSAGLAAVEERAS